MVKTSVATYEPLCNDQVARIGEERPAAEDHSLIRGCDPQPGPTPFIGGKGPFLRDQAGGDRPSGRPTGEILASDEGGFTVAARGGAVHIGKVRTEAGKRDAIAFAAETGLKPGKPSRQTVKAAGEAIREFSTDGHPSPSFFFSRNQPFDVEQALQGVDDGRRGLRLRAGPPQEQCRRQAGCIAASEPQTSIRQSSPHRPPRSVQSQVIETEAKGQRIRLRGSAPFAGYDDHFKEPHQLRIVAEAVLPHLRLPLGIGDQGQSVPPPGPSGPPPPPGKYGSSP